MAPVAARLIVEAPRGRPPGGQAGTRKERGEPPPKPRKGPIQLMSLATVAGLAGLVANTCCVSTGPLSGGQSACRAQRSLPPESTTASVTIGDNFFSPMVVRVVRDTSKKAIVTWTWTGRNPHSVTFDAGGPNSAIQRSGTFSRTFDTAGVFTYFCSVHGRAIMSGTAHVQ